MSEMVERVSRGLARVSAERMMAADPGVFLRFWDSVDYYVSQNWTKYERDARAAIEAMREPTEEMERAGDETGCFVGSDEDVGYHGRKAGIVFSAMIDAALSPKGE